MRLVIALGGNAMTSEDGSARPEDQKSAVVRAMRDVADLVAAGHEVVLTHGNGPQVGNLLLKNEMAAEVVPPVPLDWCGAQTQATIGMLVLNALDDALGERGLATRSAALVSRTLVAADDPAFATPTKPIGRYAGAEDAQAMIEHGQNWIETSAGRGWRRVVPSPEPLRSLDFDAAAALLDGGYVVVCSGGGGIPTVWNDDEGYLGIEAVIDKDLSAAILAAQLEADVLVIATDVEGAVVGFGTPDARPIGETTVRQLRSIAAEGHFAAGSMGPKVEAVLRFAERTGRTGVITSLPRIDEAVAGSAGTRVVPEPDNLVAPL